MKVLQSGDLVNFKDMFEKFSLVLNGDSTLGQGIGFN